MQLSRFVNFVVNYFDTNYVVNFVVNYSDLLIAYNDDWYSSGQTCPFSFRSKSIDAHS